jgi:simple sugar transport system ATP-binding protein
VTPLLLLDNLSHRFGRVEALRGASLTVRPGTVHALLGENGAGKSTLMRAAFGLLQPDRGELRWKGAPHRLASPAAALRLGIGMVHQHFTLVPAMTVAENVALGGHGRFDPAQAAARVRDVATRAGLTLDPDARVGTLPVGAQQRCEIVKALARDVELLILDEPTAVLAPGEAAELLAWVRRYADAGNAVVLITHKLRDALAVADDVTVLHRGRTVLTTRAAESSQEALAAAMIGEAMIGDAATGHGNTGPATTSHADTGRADTADTVGTSNAAAVATGHVVLALDGVTVRDARGVLLLREVTLTVRAGEIVGVAAVEGAGQHQLLRVLAGRMDASSGRVQRPARVGFVPEDRHRDALLLDAPLFENAALRGAGARRGRMPWAALRAHTSALLARHDVRAPHAAVAARTLSGGNQQKFVLGRELADEPEALVVENPSRGLDFMATAAVQSALRAARDGGTAVVVYSSDLDEVLLLADRVVVMYAGQLTEVARTREAAGRAMLGSER